MKRLLSLLLLVALMAMPLCAQTVKELEKKKKQALEQLATTKKMLEETRKSQKGTVNQITVLNRSIEQTNKVIGYLSIEIDSLNHDIDSLRVEKMGLEDRLKIQKEKFAKNIQRSEVMRRHFSPVMFVLSADNFSQAVRRFRYMRQMANYRKQQIREINGLTAQLNEKELELSENLNSKSLIMADKEREQRQMEKQKEQKNKILSDLKKKESSLKSQQKTQQKKADQLNAQIQAKIAAEIKRQQELERKKAEEAKRKQQQQQQQQKTQTSSGSGSTTTKPAATPTYTMSKEDQLVAGGFEKNKGRLPMPVEKGFISGHFGRQPHPVLQYVTQDNKGIYIQTPAGGYARAVYDGVVTQVFHVAGSNTSVIVKHGNYRTVYSNLTAVTVKIGDKVTAKQRLGKVYVDAQNGNKAELYFMIYKDSAIQNPESWIAK